MRKNYKKLVTNEAILVDVRKYTKEIFNSIIIQNIQKSNYLLFGNYDIEDLKDTYFSIDLQKLLIMQNESLLKDSIIYVLNTCLFFICDYKFDMINYS